MNTENNYQFRDKFYENAVKNLKASFYDVVEREEILLNNLENKIAAEKDENLKNKLLDLWTKQNDGLDRSIAIFRELANIVKVVDSFVDEFNIIYSSKDIIPTEDNTKENNNSEQVALEEKKEEIPKVEDSIVQPLSAAPINEVETPQEEVTTGPENEVSEEIPKVEDSTVQPLSAIPVNEVETPQEEVTTSLENEVSEEIPKVEDSTVQPLSVVPVNEVETPQDEVTIGLDNVSPLGVESVVEAKGEISPVPEDNAQLASLSTDEEVSALATEPENDNQVYHENAIMDEPKIVDKNPKLADDVQVQKIENNSADFDISPNDDTAAFEPITEADLENYVLPPISKEVENAQTANVGISPVQTTEPVVEDNPLPFNDDNIGYMPVPPVISDGSTEEATSVSDVPVQDVQEQDAVPVQATPLESVPEEPISTAENAINNTSSINKIKVFKSDDLPSKAIIVNDAQFSRLKASLNEQNEKLYSNNQINQSINQVVENVVNNQSSPEDIEKMLEKANELYKAGKAEEAQVLYDEIRNINQQSQEASPKLTKTA